MTAASTDRRPGAGLLAALLLGSLATATPAAAADRCDPLPGRDPLAVAGAQPLTRLAGVPVARTRAAAPGLTAGLDVALGNSFSGQVRGDDSVRLDGETAVTTLVLQWGLGRDAAGRQRAVTAEVPWVRHGGGVLDPLVDGFHDAFGFGAFGRDDVASGQIDYRVVVDGRTVVQVDDPVSALGDVRLGYAHDLLAGGDCGAQRTLTAHVAAELPTGSVRRLTGNDAVELAAALAWQDDALLAALATTVHARAGVVRAFRGDLLAGRQRDWMAFGTVGLATTPWAGSRTFGGLSLKAQVDAHGAVYDLPVDEIGGAVVTGSVGFEWRTAVGTFALHLVEDLQQHSAADVTLQAGYRWTAPR